LSAPRRKADNRGAPGRSEEGDREMKTRFSFKAEAKWILLLALALPLLGALFWLVVRLTR
jgi:hypothetical protein